jgi:hypothetical protein
VVVQRRTAPDRADLRLGIAALDPDADSPLRPPRATPSAAKRAIIQPSSEWTKRRTSRPRLSEVDHQ